jgi:hypothetical protein
VNVRDLSEYSFIGVRDRSALKPFTVSAHLHERSMSVSERSVNVYYRLTSLFKTRKGQKRSGTLDGLKRLQNHVHASKKKESYFSIIFIFFDILDKT